MKWELCTVMGCRYLASALSNIYSVAASPVSIGSGSRVRAATTPYPVLLCVPHPLEGRVALLLVNEAISLLLFAILDQTQNSQQEHHVHSHESKESRKHHVQKLVGENTEWHHAWAKPCSDRCARARRVFHEQRGVIVAAAFELELQHRLHEGGLLVPDGCEVDVCFQGAEPDLEANDQGQQCGGDDAQGVELEEEEVALAEESGDGEEEGGEHDECVHQGGCERTVVEEEVRGNVADGGGASHGGMGEQRDEEVKDCAADEEDLDGYEDEEDLVRHLNKCLIALRGELEGEL